MPSTNTDQKVPHNENRRKRALTTEEAEDGQSLVERYSVMSEQAKEYVRNLLRKSDEIRQEKRVRRQMKKMSLFET